MKVTFIEHSGFSVELEEVVLLFDYYRGELPAFPKEKHIYVFVSHGHADHYNQKIWKMKKIYPKITFILSDDILKREDAVMIGVHESVDLGQIHIETLKSNDEGVAFFVEAEGKTIYHAGDLNWWHWNGEPEEDQIYYKTTFQQEIQLLKGRKIDLAFLLLDPRQEDKYCWGMNYFLDQIQVKDVFPMHAFGKYKISNHYLNCEDGRRWKHVVHPIIKPQEEFILP